MIKELLKLFTTAEIVLLVLGSLAVVGVFWWISSMVIVIGG